MSKLRAFYRNEQPNSEGLMFDEIIEWSDFFWEATHDHIQHVFPTKKPSAFNADAPLLTDEDIAIWKQDPVLKSNLRTAYLRWINFLGLTEIDNQVVFAGNMTKEQVRLWQHYNHNFRRITRVLDSLTTLGLKQEANSFYDFLKLQYEIRSLPTWEGEKVISANALNWWTKAINGEI